MLKRETMTVACLAVLLLLASVAAGDVQPTTIEQLQSFYPQVDDKANAALVYQKAKEMHVMSEFDRRIPVVGSGKSPGIPAKPLEPDVKTLTVDELQKNAATLQLLHQASNMPQCRFPIDLTKGRAVLLVHLSYMRDLARLLELQAINAADNQNPELATQSVLDIIAIARSLRKEPVIISQLVRIACWGIAIDALEQVVNRVPLEEKALVQFQDSLANADNREALTRAFQAELCICMSAETETAEEKAAREAAIAEYEEKTRAKQADDKTETESGSDSGDVAAVEDGNREETREQPPEGRSQFDAESPQHREPVPPDIAALFQPKMDPKVKEETLQEIRRRINESRIPYADFIKLIPQLDPKTISSEQRMELQRSMGNQRVPELRRSMVSAARMAAKAAAAQGAIAVERYRLKNGTLPAQWKDLVPDYLAASVQDPFVKNGDLLLRATDGGYIVYSVGQNGRDDGGTEGDGRPPLDHVFRVEQSVQAGK